MSRPVRQDRLEALPRFVAAVDPANATLIERWLVRDSIDVFELTLDVLFFRNTYVYESVTLLLREARCPSAEMLLRPLLEGTTIFEWCMLEPKSRPLRFRLAALESTLELIDSGYLKRNAEWVRAVRESLEWAASQGHRPIPNMRQMAEEVSSFRPGARYNLYKHLSKVTHGSFENWVDFDPAVRASEDNLPGSQLSDRVAHCLGIAGFLQLRNIALVSGFDDYLRFEQLADLEEAWAAAYEELEDKDTSFS